MLREGREAGDLAGLELGKKPGVLGPEQSDIRYVEEKHCNSFETKAKSPADSMGDIRRVEKLLLDNTAAKEFQPFTLPEDFELKGRAGEGEVCFNPSDFQRFSSCGRVFSGSSCGGKDPDDEKFQRAF